MKRRGILVGYSPSGKPLYYTGPGGLLLAAPARGGKGRDVLTPALLNLDDGSVIVVDPKAQNCAITYRQRQRLGHRVVLLDPFGLGEKFTGIKSSRYNPMKANLDPEARTLGIECDKLADGLIWDDGGGKYWTEGAKDWAAGGMAALMLHGSEAEKNLAVLRDIVAGDFFGFCRKVVAETPDRFVKQKLQSAADASAPASKEAQDKLATLRVHTRFIGNEIMSDSLSGSDFCFAEIRTTPTTVFLILPLDELEVCGKWFRLVVVSAISELMRHA